MVHRGTSVEEADSPNTPTLCTSRLVQEVEVANYSAIPPTLSITHSLY
jgi:hypothetical protein